MTFFTPVTVKYMEKNLGITKPRYSEHILPVTWPFVISKLHCRRIIAQAIPSVLIPPPRAFVGLFSSWKFVRKPLPRGRAFVNSSRRG